MPVRAETPRGIPPSLRDGTRWRLIRRWANGVRALYGVPIWLCGSALKWGNADPRDYDVRLELPADDFRRRYGDPVEWETQGGSGLWTRVRWRWSDDCLKMSREGYARTTLNIDFQVYPLAYARRMYRGERRVRLDTRGR